MTIDEPLTGRFIFTTRWKVAGLLSVIVALLLCVTIGLWAVPIFRIEGFLQRAIWSPDRIARATHRKWLIRHLQILDGLPYTVQFIL